jgi:hypothetical protein
MKKMDKREYNRLYKRKQRGSVLSHLVTGVTKEKIKIAFFVTADLKERIKEVSFLEKKGIATFLRDFLEENIPKKKT